MNLRISRRDERVLEEVVGFLSLNLSRIGRGESEDELRDYLLDTFFNPTRRVKTIHAEGRHLPDLDDLVEEDAIRNLEDNGLLMVVGSKVVPTPLGLDFLQTGSDLNKSELIIEFQFRLAKKLVETFTLSHASLDQNDMAALVFLLYNNNTSTDRGEIGDSELSPIIDKITDSFAKGEVSKGTRSLNGRPGGGYFVRANMKLEFPIVMKQPKYYIRSSEIRRVKEELAKSVDNLVKQEGSTFNPINSLVAFEECFDRHISDLVRLKALFATEKSKRDVRRIISRGEYDGNSR